MATVHVWIEEVDYSTAVGDADPTIRDVESREFTAPVWLDAVDAAYTWIRQRGRNPNECFHVSM